jgi:hypothetical protein
VQGKRVIGDLEPQAVRNRALPLLDTFVGELFDPAAVYADDVVVVSALVQLEDGRAALEMMPGHQAGRLELGQHAVDGGEADVLVHFQEAPIDILGAHVPCLRIREDLEDLHARHGDLEASPTEM